MNEAELVRNERWNILIRNSVLAKHYCQVSLFVGTVLILGGWVSGLVVLIYDTPMTGSNSGERLSEFISRAILFFSNIFTRGDFIFFIFIGMCLIITVQLLRWVRNKHHQPQIVRRWAPQFLFIFAVLTFVNAFAELYGSLIWVNPYGFGTSKPHIFLFELLSYHMIDFAKAFIYMMLSQILFSMHRRFNQNEPDVNRNWANLLKVGSLSHERAKLLSRSAKAVAFTLILVGVPLHICELVLSGLEHLNPVSVIYSTTELGVTLFAAFSLITSVELFRFLSEAYYRSRQLLGFAPQIILLFAFFYLCTSVARLPDMITSLRKLRWIIGESTYHYLVTSSTLLLECFKNFAVVLICIGLSQVVIHLQREIRSQLRFPRETL